MRTTLTLDDDIAKRLASEARRTGRPLKAIINEHLRTSLAHRRSVRTAPPFEVKPVHMGGALRSIDRISTLLEELDGPTHK